MSPPFVLPAPKRQKTGGRQKSACGECPYSCRKGCKLTRKDREARAIRGLGNPTDDEIDKVRVRTECDVFGYDADHFRPSRRNRTAALRPGSGGTRTARDLFNVLKAGQLIPPHYQFVTSLVGEEAIDRGEQGRLMERALEEKIFDFEGTSME